MLLRILYQDDHLVAVDKPAGFHVHPPEDQRHRISPRNSCLHLLRDQLGRYVYPVHRLDRATSGVLLFALDSETASALGLQFQQHQVLKTYYCVTRGWMDPISRVETPLSSDSSPEPELAPSITLFSRLSTIEIPQAVGRYSTARYSLMRAEPKSGRMHQIRRHCAGQSHPIVGDTVYGDGVHNRFFRETFELRSLLLKAQKIEFQHPATGKMLRVESRWTGPWHRVFDLFSCCPV